MAKADREREAKHNPMISACDRAFKKWIADNEDLQNVRTLKEFHRLVFKEGFAAGVDYVLINRKSKG